MALALEARAKADDILIGDTPKAVRRRRRLKGVQTSGRIWKHSTLSDVEGLVSRTEMASMFCFMLVRNPWDRMVSYYFWLREQQFDNQMVTLAKTVGFSQFLNSRKVGDSFRTNPYSRYLTDGAGQCHADLYIRLENLSEDLTALERQLGFSLELTRVNTSTRAADWREYYSQNDADLVADICRKDIEKFDYRFDE